MVINHWMILNWGYCFPLSWRTIQKVCLKTLNPLKKKISPTLIPCFGWKILPQGAAKFVLPAGRGLPGRIPPQESSLDQVTFLLRHGGPNRCDLILSKATWVLKQPRNTIQAHQLTEGVDLRGKKTSSSWWLNQPIWKIWSSSWIISPKFRGKNQKNMFETTNQSYTFIETKNKSQYETEKLQFKRQNINKKFQYQTKKKAPFFFYSPT